MAKIKKNETVVTYNLTLTEMEAKTLSCLLGKIGGCCVSSMRYYTDSIARTLRQEINGDEVAREFTRAGVLVRNRTDTHYASLYFNGPKIEEKCPEDVV